MDETNTYDFARETKARMEGKAQSRPQSREEALLEAAQQAEYWLQQDDRTIEPTEILRVLRAAIAAYERSHK